MSIYTTEECNKFYKYETRYDRNVYTTPDDRYVTKESEEFKRVDAICKSLKNKEFVEKLVGKWLKDPLKNPINDEPIEVSIYEKSIYAKLYDISYSHLKRKRMPINEIKAKLPKHHLLFNLYDILLFSYDKTLNDKDLKDNYIYIYEIIKFNNTKFKYLSDRSISNYQNTIISILVEKYISYMLPLLSSLNLFNYNIHSEQFSYRANEISIKTDNLMKLSKFLTYSNIYDIFDAEIHKDDDKLFNDYIEFNTINYDYEEKNFITNVISFLKTVPNVCEKLLEYYDELYNIYNCKNAPEKSPFVNLDNISFDEIEDPLITVINRIGRRNINLETLSLDERPFQNDEEYQKYYDRYHTIKKRYRDKVDTIRASIDTANQSATISMPPMPIMRLPNGKTINVVTQVFPHYIKDKTYSRIVKEYEKNKHILNMYKTMNILELIKLSKSSRWSRWFSTGIVQNSHAKLINKDIDYFIKNVLNDGTDNKKKCNSNIDIISQEEFNDKDYPLAKLQLMFQLERDNHTHCFYAPNFYNLIIKSINNKVPLKIPGTEEVLSNEEREKVIDDIMVIMRVFDPNMQRPFYIDPSHDKELRIIYGIDLQYPEYYNISIVRTLLGVEYYIYHICTIPIDIEIIDSESTNITSSSFIDRIFTLFNKYMLMHTYLPPYFIINDNDKEYIKLSLHFNNYYSPLDWLYLSQEEKIHKFKHYFTEMDAYFS